MDEKWEIYKGTVSEWNNFIYNNNSQYRQLYEWGESKKKLGWHILRVVKQKNNKILICAQINIKKKFLFTICYIPGGIVGDLKFFDKGFFKIIKDLFNSKFIYIRADFVKLKSESDKKSLENCNWSKPTYKMNNEIYISVDLSKSNQEILKDAKQKWRYHYKKSLSQELICELQENPNADYIVKVNEELSRRNNVRNIYQSREINSWIESLKDKLLVTTIFNKKKEILGVRSSVVVDKVAWHNFSGVNQKGRDTLAGYQLLFFMFDICRSKGIKKINLGELNFENWPGPYRFKNGLYKSSIIFSSLGEWEWSNFVLLKNIINSSINIYLKSNLFLSKIIKNL